MVALALFGLTSLSWGAMGITMTVLPEVWLAFLNRLMNDAWRRFWVTQGMILGGLVLAMGTTTFQGFGLWVACGFIAVWKACILLGSSEAFGTRLMQIVRRWPYWVYRGCGLVTLVLAVLLAADVMLHG